MLHEKLPETLRISSNQNIFPEGFSVKHNRRTASMLKRIITLVIAVLMLSSLTLTAFASSAEITANETGDRNVLFSNGYRGFCLDNQLHGAYSGDVFTPSDTSNATSNTDNNDVSQILKKLFAVCFDDVFAYNEATALYEIKDTNTVQAVVWHYTDNFYIWGEQLKLANAIDAYDGPEIPDSGYKLHLDNGHIVTFHFMVMKAQSGETQDFFAYRLEIDKEESHEHEYTDTWKSDDTQHWLECSCGEKNGAADHTETVINRKDPAEFEEGYTGDTVCEVCGRLLEEGQTIPGTHEHSFGESWKSDDTQHWHECSCGEKEAAAGHTETVINREDPTEYEDGYTGDTVCEVCGRLLEEGQTIPGTHEHSFGESWKSDDTQHWYECSCGEKEAAAGHTETVINREDPTEYEDGYTGDTVCEVCRRLLKEGQTIPGTHEHSFGESWKSDDTWHWHECSCGEKEAVAGHTETVINRKFPSEFEDGYTGDIVCEVCRWLLEEGQTIPATHEHAFSESWKSDNSQHWHACRCGEKEATADHSETVINRKDPAEFEEGYTGDTVCEICGKLLEKGETIPITHEHTFRKTWKVSKDKHWHECRCGAIADLASHKGGEATCKALPRCSECNMPYGSTDPENHVGGTRLRGFVAPTEDKPGYTGDTYCRSCNELIKKGTKMPVLSNYSPPPTGDNFNLRFWLILSLTSLTGCVIVLLIIKKNYRK